MNTKWCYEGIKGENDEIRLYDINIKKYKWVPMDNYFELYSPYHKKNVRVSEFYFEKNNERYYFATGKVSYGAFIYYTKNSIAIKNELIDSYFGLILIAIIATVMLTIISWLSSGWVLGLFVCLVMLIVDVLVILLGFWYTRKGFRIDVEKNEIYFHNYIHIKKFKVTDISISYKENKVSTLITFKYFNKKVFFIDVNNDKNSLEMLKDYYQHIEI